METQNTKTNLIIANKSKYKYTKLREQRTLKTKNPVYTEEFEKLMLALKRNSRL